jgi:MFS family permease
MAVVRRADTGASRAGSRAPWLLVLRVAAALAVSMGIGRFAYTPILPLMHSQAGLSAQYGSALAIANYAGYLIGALLGIAAPALVRSALALRAGLIVLIGTLALMAATENHPAWFVLRLTAGVASAIVFMIAVTAMLTQLRGPAQHLTGWGFGGVGAGIALSGAVVLVLRTTPDWRTAWVSCAALAFILTAVSWPLRPGPARAPTARQRPGGLPSTHRWFGALLASYTLEGVGYIIAGTFLVAAINQNSPAWVGSGAWVLVGLAALPAPALWSRLSQRWTRPTLLLSALLIQAAGIALPALAGGAGPALVSAVLFGGTFLGVASLALALGAHLQYPRAVAVLTTGYSTGQILGPLVVTPLLHSSSQGGGYRTALLVSAAVVLAAAAAAAVLRIGFPRRVGVMIEPSHQVTGRG